MKSIKKKMLKLAQLNNSPQDIALGVAVGVFIAHTPFYGFHTFIALAFAVLIRRVNKIAILSGLLVTVPPIAPFVYWIEYKIGRIVLGNSYPSFSWVTWEHFINHSMRILFYPLFVGGVILGIVNAIIFYCAVLFLIRKIRIRYEPVTSINIDKIRDMG